MSKKKYSHIKAIPAGEDKIILECEKCGKKTPPLWGWKLDKALENFIKKHGKHHSKPETLMEKKLREAMEKSKKGDVR